MYIAGKKRHGSFASKPGSGRGLRVLRREESETQSLSGSTIFSCVRHEDCCLIRACSLALKNAGSDDTGERTEVVISMNELFRNPSFA